MRGATPSAKRNRVPVNLTQDVNVANVAAADSEIHNLATEHASTFLGNVLTKPETAIATKYISDTLPTAFSAYNSKV